MESLPIGLTLKKKKKKIQTKQYENKNIIVNELVQNLKHQLKNIIIPKTNYLTNIKNEDVFPENYIFSKTFPNLFSYLENLDKKFSEKNKTNTSDNKDIIKSLKKYIIDQIFLWSPDIIGYKGYYLDKLDKKFKIHTIIFLYI